MTPASLAAAPMAIPGAGGRVAVLSPGYHEARASAPGGRDFRAARPAATVYVYDNNSSDGTRQVAREAGAVVRLEALQGKGHVVRRMFADIDAALYVLVDGDGTYDAQAAPGLIRALRENGLDMVNAARVTDRAGAYRRGHVVGNRVLTGLVAAIFGNRLSDMLYGHRAFSRRSVKSSPALSAGFETETELSVHALELRMPIAELPTRYIERVPGSVSKLHTFRDGMRILRTIVMLMKQERPLAFFSAIAGAMLLLGLALGLPVVAEFFRTRHVPRLPSAVLALGFVLLACLAEVCGLILDSVARGRLEFKRLAYLSHPAPETDPVPAP